MAYCVSPGDGDTEKGGGGVGGKMITFRDLQSGSCSLCLYISCFTAVYCSMQHVSPKRWYEVTKLHGVLSR